MKFVIVTGMSGAGKSTVLKILEDMDFYCVDNIPIPLIGRFAELSFGGNEKRNVALGVDIRSGNLTEDLKRVFSFLEAHRYPFSILFMDAADEVLIKRFKETRRLHPLTRNGHLAEAIKKERELLSGLKDMADHVIDTTALLTRELKSSLDKLYGAPGKDGKLNVMLMSFGFKYGIPQECDLIFDVRFLPNPYYVEELRNLTGNDEAVANYVMNHDVYRNFIEKLRDMILFLLPNYQAEGKNNLVIGMGCTGGHHRSVTVANHMNQILSETGLYHTELYHRDI